MLRHLPLLSSAVVSACFGQACIDASQKPCVEPQSAAAAAAPPAATATASTLKTCAAPSPAADGLLDDFEDGNGQLTLLAGRDGYWWQHHDPSGSTIAPEKFTPDSGGAGGSQKALHVTGTTASQAGAYGSSVGVNFASSGLYDASQYVGVSFRAKVGPNSTPNVRFKIGDSNTHGQLGTCKSCWNHFGKDLSLTNEWQEYRVLFAETKQVDGWGDPRPPALNAAELANLDWSIGPGANFDLWIDDVTFLSCP